MAENKKNYQQEEKREERVVRILSEDIEGKMTIYSGLTKIKGISWALSKAICEKLGIDRKKKIGSLTEKEIETLSKFMKNPTLPKFILNRRKDFETGEDKHIIGSTLDLQKEFDIKKLKKIKSYRGYRHMSGLPMRGQRTRSHFRTNRRKGAGIKKKNIKQ